MSLAKIKDFIPVGTFDLVSNLLKAEQVSLKIKKERKTRHGDYKRLPNGRHEITINSNLNRYKFLMTLIHEIAHLKAYNQFGKNIKPHGKEWKYTFKMTMLPFLNPQVFPDELLAVLARHFKNPKASSDSDQFLARALKTYDEPNGNIMVIDIDEGHTFRLYNGKEFLRGKQRRKRIECKELKSGRLYLFNPLAEVELLNTNSVNKSLV